MLAICMCFPPLPILRCVIISSSFPIPFRATSLIMSHRMWWSRLQHATALPMSFGFVPVWTLTTSGFSAARMADLTRARDWRYFCLLNTTHETKLQRHYLLFKECFSKFRFFLVWKGRIPWWLVRSLGLLQHSASWPACLPLTSYNIGSADFGKHYTADFSAWSVDPTFLLFGQWPLNQHNGQALNQHNGHSESIVLQGSSQRKALGYS